MKTKHADAIASAFTQRVMGKLTWEEYIRLRRFSKATGKTHEVLIREAILEYLNHREQETT